MGEVAHSERFEASSVATGSRPLVSLLTGSRRGSWRWRCEGPPTGQGGGAYSEVRGRSGLTVVRSDASHRLSDVGR